MARIISILSLLIIIFFGYNFFFKTKKADNLNPIITISINDSALIDSLKSYNYHLVVGKQRKMRGAAFYLNFHSKNYIISTLHTFTGIDPDSKKLIDGLSETPHEIFAYQFDTFLDSPWGETYSLYKNNVPVFIKGRNNGDFHVYDIAAYPISLIDTAPLPNHILKYDVKWETQILNINDTIFYWGYVMNKANQSMFPTFYVGKIIDLPIRSNPYIVSDIFSRPGNSGAPVFKISNKNIYLIGIITRGNPDAKIVYITPFKESFPLLNL
jgi:hypothetical protein